MKTTIFAAAVLAFSPIPSQAAEPFQAYDEDSSGVLDADEVQARTGLLLERFDEDDVPGLTASEMHSLVFHFWDRDDSGGISREEFIRPGDWDSGFDALDFPRYDVDIDDRLDKSEFMAFNASEMYGRWDLNADGLIDGSELSKGLAEVIDIDEEAGLSPEEFSAIPPRL